MQKKNHKRLSCKIVGIAGIAGIIVFGTFRAEAETPVKEEKTVEQQQLPNSPVDMWQTIPETVASVNGRAITRKDLETFMKAQMPGGVLPPSLTTDKLKLLAPRIVRGMVEQQLLESAMTKAQYTLTQQDAATILKKEIDSLSKEQRDALEKQLAAEKSSIDKKVQEITGNPQMMKQLGLKMFIEQTILASVQPATDAEIKDYYEKNNAQFEHPKQYQVSHILYEVKEKDGKDDKVALEKAQKTYKKLQEKPQEFETLAKAESTCPSKEQGGKLPPFAPGLGTMDKDFENAVVKIDKPGTIVGPIKTGFGYHLIRLDEVIPPKTDSFETAKSEIVRYLSGQRQQAAMSQYLKNLETENNVQYMVK